MYGTMNRYTLRFYTRMVLGMPMNPLDMMCHEPLRKKPSHPFVLEEALVIPAHSIMQHNTINQNFPANGIKQTCH